MSDRGDRRATRSPSRGHPPSHSGSPRSSPRRYNASRYSPSFGPKRSPRSEPTSRERPNFQPTGKLVDAALTKNGVRLKYAEPAERCRPEKKWRLYMFKGDQQLGMIPLYPQTCLRFGRDPKVGSWRWGGEALPGSKSTGRQRRVGLGCPHRARELQQATRRPPASPSGLGSRLRELRDQQQVCHARARTQHMSLLTIDRVLDHI